jgi:hypothetical protein
MEQVVKPRLRGKAFLIRYADDFVMGFTHEQDVRRVLAVLPQRLGKYGLAIHPDKTRLIAFQEPAKAAYKKDAGSGPAGTFAARPLGGEAKDGVESPEPGVAEHRPVVSG